MNAIITKKSLTSVRNNVLKFHVKKASSSLPKEIEKYGLEINKVYNEDCLIGMQRIKDKSIDMILCDLPYGTTNNKWDSVIPLEDYIDITGTKNTKHMNKDEFLLLCYQNGLENNKAKKKWKENKKLGLWSYYKRIIKDDGAIVLTASNPFTSKLIESNPNMFKYVWCWEKSLKTNFLNAKKQPLRCHEDIVIFYKKPCTYNPQGLKKGSISGGNKITGSYNSWEANSKKQTHTGYPSSVLKIANPNQGNIHPTQKPVELGEYLVSTYSNEGDIVLDNTCGSGSFLIAAKNKKRNFIGFEYDMKQGYFQKLQKRLKEHAQKGINRKK